MLGQIFERLKGAFSVTDQRVRHFSVAFMAAAVFSGGYLVGTHNSTNAQQTTPSPEAEAAFEAFWQVYNLIDTQFIDDVDSAVLVDGAARGMVDALEDEYSGYMDAREYPLLNSELSGEYTGIGVVITTNDETDAIEIVGFIPNSPAIESGLMPGDVFFAVDGEEVGDWDQSQFAARVRGEAGTDVTITVRRGDELLDFTITRARIITPNVEWELLDNDIAYIKLNTFSADARTLLDTAIEELDVIDRAGLIIDLRDNTGGLLSSAIDITSAFVRDGVVVTEEFGDDRQQDFEATGDYANIDVPIVVLTNELTASASEILAGALQDLKIATLIGEVTLGKGTVQTWSPLVNGGGVRLTIARWVTPSGRWIHDQGVTPDIRIDWTPERYQDTNDIQLDAAVDFLLGEAVEQIIATPTVTPDAP